MSWLTPELLEKGAIALIAIFSLVQNFRLVRRIERILSGELKRERKISQSLRTTEGDR